MSGGLQHVGDDDVTRCVHCGKPAAGPCASCHKPVCGDCCTLTEGGLTTFAICLDCDRRGGRSLDRGFTRMLLGFGAIILVLAIFAVLSLVLFR